MGFIPNLNIDAKNMSCIVFWKLLCVRKSRPVYICKKLRVQANSCMRIARVSFGLIFQKLIYFLIKSYIFHFNTS